MNPALILTRNCLSLTKRCVDSLQKQDIPVSVHIIDNGSTDGTLEWAIDNKFLLAASTTNAGVSAGWNRGLTEILKDHERCLCIGNDTILPPWGYRLLLSYNEGFVTGVAVDSLMQIAEPPQYKAKEKHPDFSAFLISRDVWDKVGPFDERMKLYASDCDFHVRAHRMGIDLFKVLVPYYHERSSTLRLASAQDQIEIHTQANKDRAVFREIYGCLPGEPAYEEMFR